MPNIFYTANNYSDSYSYINTAGQSSISCRKIDLYRAIVTVGNPSFLTLNSIRQFGLFRALSDSIIQKVLLVQSYIESDYEGMRLHPIFQQQVTDQKRIVSYNLGMTFAKIYSERLLDIQNLIHVETLKKNDAIVFNNNGSSTREPDLVGQSGDGKWHVFEAKGVSSNKLGSKVKDAKEQAEKIETIYGQIPGTLTACATYFGPEKIISMIIDPDAKGKKKINIKRRKFYETYYNPFVAIEKMLGDQAQKVVYGNSAFYEVKLPTNDLHLTMGLDEEIYHLIKEKSYALIPEAVSKKRPLLKDGELTFEHNMSLGLDGFLLRYTNYSNKKNNHENILVPRGPFTSFLQDTDSKKRKA